MTRPERERTAPPLEIEGDGAAVASSRGCEAPPEWGAAFALSAAVASPGVRRLSDGGAAVATPGFRRTAPPEEEGAVFALTADVASPTFRRLPGAACAAVASPDFRHKAPCGGAAFALTADLASPGCPPAFNALER